VNRLRKMRWAEHVSCMRYEKCIQKTTAFCDVVPGSHQGDDGGSTHL
jgi:hypothetical protein